MMGRLRQILGLGPDEFVLIRSSPSREHVERFEPGEEPSPVDVEFGDYQDGKYRLQAVSDGVFGEVRWSREVGDVEEAKEIEELRSELQNLRRAINRQDKSDDSGTLKERSINAVLRGDLDPRYLETIAALNATWEDPDSVSLSELVEDPTDLREVIGAGSLKMLDNYNSVDELLADVTEGGLKGLDRADGGRDQEVDHADETGGGDDRWERIDGGASSINELSENDSDGNDDYDLARPEARYRLRFPGQYGEEEVAEAREVLPDHEVTDIEGKRGGLDDKQATIDDSASGERSATDSGENDAQCAFIKDDGERCGNSAEDGSEYCWIDSHTDGVGGVAEPSTPSERAEEIAEALPDDTDTADEEVTAQE